MEIGAWSKELMGYKALGSVAPPTQLRRWGAESIPCKISRDETQPAPGTDADPFIPLYNKYKPSIFVTELVRVGTPLSFS